MSVSLQIQLTSSFRPRFGYFCRPLWYLLDLLTYIWYFCRYYLLLFSITISFSDAFCLVHLSYIFPQCQPLHYGYTPGNVYLFTGPLEARKIQRCSYFWCFFTILVISIAANAQLLENASHQPVRMDKCLLCTILPCYANESCCHLDSPDFRKRFRSITPLFGDMHEPLAVTAN